LKILLFEYLKIFILFEDIIIILLENRIIIIGEIIILLLYEIIIIEDTIIVSYDTSGNVIVIL